MNLWKANFTLLLLPNRDPWSLSWCLKIFIRWSINISEQNIGDNYRIYNLIIILNVKIVVSVRCGLFKMSNMNHLTMFLSNSNSHGCFTLLSMHKVFSTKFSIALTNVEDFFKCTQAIVLWEFWINHESVCARVCFFLETWFHASSWTWWETTCYLLVASRICMQKNLWSSSCSFFHSLLFKMWQESTTLQESRNLEVDQKLPSTLQTQHPFYACLLVGSIAKSKV
jgi:hypothetical protein